MLVGHTLLTADPHLGRVAYGSFSDQALMEMLIEGFDHNTKSKYQDKHGMYREVYKWPCIECDDDDKVIEIDINSLHVTGSLALCYVPPKVKALNISLGWGRSELAGSVDLTNLPDGMSDLHLHNNNLGGGIDLTQLPDGMGYLYLQNNKFTGEIDLTQFPKGMTQLDLQNNNLRGEIDLTRLSDGMEYLTLNNNQLRGSLVIKNLPPKMGFINVEANHFNAIAVVNSEVRAFINLEGSGVASVVDENGREVNKLNKA